MLFFIGICVANSLYQVQNCSRERGGGLGKQLVQFLKIQKVSSHVFEFGYIYFCRKKSTYTDIFPTIIVNVLEVD
jgi:hypothetical protein